MSILIKGMEMPTDDMKNIMILADGRVFQFPGYGNPEPLGTAVPVPPHGRLGDLDAFESVKYELPNGKKAFNRGFHSGVQFMQRLIMDAPTIIPAEDGE